MALLHVKLLSLRNKGIRTASATLMVVVFFSGVFLLVLHPSSHHPHPKSGTLPLSADLKDVSVRELFSLRTALGANTGENENNFSATVIQEKNGHHDSNSNNYDEKKSDQDDKESDKAVNEVKMMMKDDGQKGRLQSEPDSKPGNAHGKDNLEAVKGDDKPQSRSEQTMEKSKVKIPVHTDLSPQSSNLSQPVPLTVHNPDRQPKVHKPDSGTMSKPHRFQILGSNLEILPFQPFASPFIDSSKNDGTMEKKVITWYQPRKGLSDSDQKQILLEMKHKRKLLKNCPEPKCRLVYPLPRGVRADAVVFSDVDTSVAPPTRRHADQVYVLHKMSPPSSPSPLQPAAAAAAAVWSAAWRWTFNWTWSYRRDSNIWQPLGLLRHSDTILPVDYFITLAESKTRAVAWIPRTCPLFRKTASKRNEFVEELRTYIPVTEFGSCSNHMCASENASCSQLLSQQFFFLLALEDELCPDYITEVFYRAWQEGTYVLPVVRGGANYASYFPLGTYIDANWFENVKQLYDFLAELIEDRKLYAQLLWRKSHWIKAARKTEELALCHLCYKLHNMGTASRTYLDVFRWLERSSCQHRS